MLAVNLNTNATSIGNINPFRYRGYYYDVETGFYYLQTRYYDPTICRFINADNYELVAELSQTVGQLNLYAYANNNPIMLTDETGEIATWIITLIAMGVGAILGGVYNGVKSYHEGNAVGKIVLEVFVGVGAGIATIGGAMMIGGVGIIAVRSISRVIGVAAWLTEMTYVGAAGAPLGLLLGLLLGLHYKEKNS